MRAVRNIALMLALFAVPGVLGGPPTKEPLTYRDTVKKVLPAVVSLEPQARPASARASRNAWPTDLIPWLPLVGAQADASEKKPVRLGAGSGFIVDPKGVIVTNYHVVRGASQVEVCLKDGRTFVSRNIKVDPKTDLAIVTITTKELLPSLEWGDSTATEIGDRVLAVGAPFGLTGSVTHGIISGKGRSLNLLPYEDYVQTDAAINPGNSGGPLVTLDGKVIGVNSVIKSRSGGFQGVGLAVSSLIAKSVVDDLMKNGTVTRAYIGVRISDLDWAVAERMGLAGKGGVVVADVLPDTPAAKAGLQDGDIITALAGKPVPSAAELTWAVSRLESGKSVEVSILRDGKMQTLAITPEKQSDNVEVAAKVRKPSRAQDGAIHLSKIGAWASDATPELAERFGFKDHVDGAMIVRVDPDGWAAATGLRPGTVIVKVDDTAVMSAKEAAQAIENGSLASGIQFRYRSANAGTGYVMIRTSSAE